MKNLYKLSIWFLIFMGMLSIAFSLMTTPSTINNILGLIIILISVGVSIKTECFTKKLKRKRK